MWICVGRGGGGAERVSCIAFGRGRMELHGVLPVSLSRDISWGVVGGTEKARVKLQRQRR
eukprot:357916-Chlamydomonas_euryale.AAC.7